MRYRFGGFELDTDRLALVDPAGDEVHLEPRVFDLLGYLLENRERTVTKQELIDGVWDGAFVSDSALKRAVYEARRILRDHGGDAETLKTVHGRGYRFDAPVEVATAEHRGPGPGPAAPVGAGPENIEPRRLERIAGSDRDPDRAPATRPPGRRRVALAVTAALGLALALAVLVPWSGLRDAVAPKDLTLAVLPFENLSPEPESEYFAYGVTEEITTKLSKIEGLRIAARSSVMGLTDPRRDLGEVGEALGVRYLLLGSVRKAGDRVRITARLVDPTTTFHLWAGDFEGSLEDIFAAQEETALKVAEALDLALTPGEREAVLRRGTASSAAYDAYLRGRSVLDTAQNLEAARAHFEEALALDPRFARAWAGLAQVEGLLHRNREADPARLERAKLYARRAVETDPDLAEGHRALGRIYGNEYDYQRAEKEFLEALRREPGDASTWLLLAWARAYQQPPKPAAAEDAAREAIRRDPSNAAAHYQLGRALLLRKRYELAAESFEHSLELRPWGAPHLGLAELHLAQGEPERALAELQRVESLESSAVALVQLAAVHAARGDDRAALAALGNALSAGYRDFAYLDASTNFDRLRETSDFADLLSRFRPGSP